MHAHQQWRLRIATLAAVLVAALLGAEGVPPSIWTGGGAPGGACFGARIALLPVGRIFSCIHGAWADVSPSGAPVSEASTGTAGLVLTGAQTFGGAKTFQGQVTLSGGVVVGSTGGVGLRADLILGSQPSSTGVRFDTTPAPEGATLWSWSSGGVFKLGLAWGGIALRPVAGPE